MQTTFILHGGMISYDNEENNSFFREFTREISDGEHILHIGFARREPSERKRVYERDASLIHAQTDKDIEVVSATKEKFLDQLEGSSRVFVTGGDTAGLISDISEFTEFAKLLQGKTIAGSSAGAYLFSTFFFSSSQKGVCSGLGILPIRILCHYGDPEFEATDAALNLLKTYPGDTELIALKECEWTIRERDL